MQAEAKTCDHHGVEFCCRVYVAVDHGEFNGASLPLWLLDVRASPGSHGTPTMQSSSVGTDVCVAASDLTQVAPISSLRQQGEGSATLVITDMLPALTNGANGIHGSSCLNKAHSVPSSGLPCSKRNDPW